MKKLETIFKRHCTSSDYLTMREKYWEFLKDYSKELLEHSGKNFIFNDWSENWDKPIKGGNLSYTTEELIDEFNNLE